MAIFKTAWRWMSQKAAQANPLTELIVEESYLSSTASIERKWLAWGTDRVIPALVTDCGGCRWIYVLSKYNHLRKKKDLDRCQRVSEESPNYLVRPERTNTTIPWLILGGWWFLSETQTKRWQASLKKHSYPKTRALMRRCWNDCDAGPLFKSCVVSVAGGGRGPGTGENLQLLPDTLRK